MVRVLLRSLTRRTGMFIFSSARIARALLSKNSDGLDDAVDREIAGFSKFDIPHILTAAQKAEKGSGPRNRDSLPQGTNVALYDEFFGQIDQALWKWVDPEKDTCNQAILPSSSLL